MDNKIIEVLSNICGNEQSISTVVGSAPYHGTDFLRNAIDMLKTKDKFDKAIGVDGGAKVLLDLGYVPDLFIGDCDSFKNAKDSIFFANADKEKVFVFPSEKDDTDMQLAIETAVKEGAGKVVLLCVTNGRLDHFLGCFQLLEYFGETYDMPAKLIIVDEQNVIFYVSSNEDCITFDMVDDLYFSIIPISEKIDGLTIKGAKYLLENYDLTRGISRCISNCLPDGAVNGRVEISKKSGALSIVVSKDA